MSMQIRYTIKAGKLSESGVVDTFRELTNRLKQYEGFGGYTLEATEEEPKYAGKMQKG
jgi:hypothetical protein